MSTTSRSAWETEQLAALRQLASALAQFAAKKSYWVGRRKRRKELLNLYYKRKRTLLAISYRAGRDLIRDARNKPCTDCRFFFPDHMSFDHLPGQVKQFDLGHSRHRTLNQIKRELAKCELCCCLCHYKRECARGSLSGHTCRVRAGFCPLYAAKPWREARAARAKPPARPRSRRDP